MVWVMEEEAPEDREDRELWLEPEEAELDDGGAQASPGSQSFGPGTGRTTQMEFWHSVWEPQGMSSEQSLGPGLSTLKH